MFQLAIFNNRKGKTGQTRNIGNFLHGDVNLNRYGKFLVLVGTIDVVGVIGDVGDDSVCEKKTIFVSNFFAVHIEVLMLQKRQTYQNNLHSKP